MLNEIKQIIEDNLGRILSLRAEKILKSDQSFVSKGDLLCEELIKNFLKENYPNVALVSEESPADNLINIESDIVLILDPIDGTENFVSGLKEWGVALCLYDKGKHVDSMLALPELGQYMQSGDKFDRFDSRIAGLSSSLTREDLLKLERGFEYRIIGCCVYNMFNVIRGSYKTFENPKGAWIWDIIPGLNLALEQGLSVKVNNENYNGELLRPDQKYRFKISEA